MAKNNNSIPTEDSMDGYSLRKEEFKNRILDAAETLILETGDVSFSTRDLAKNAGVSFATPFNHFGSKLGVLDAIIERSLTLMPRTPAQRAGDSVDRLLTGVHPAITYYSKQSKLYRPIYGAVLGRTTDIRNSGSPSLVRAIAMWRHSLVDAKSEGLIAKGRNIDLIADLIEHNWIGSVLSWIHHSLSAEDWRNLFSYNVALTLCGIVTEERRPKLLKSVASLEKQLRHLSRA
jgi:AcrR family transcriptional regulator